MVEESLGRALPGAMLGADIEIPLWEPNFSLYLNPDGTTTDILDGTVFRPFVIVDLTVHTAD